MGVTIKLGSEGEPMNMMILRTIHKPDKILEWHSLNCFPIDHAKLRFSSWTSSTVYV